jgi:hypothetical protein
LGRVLIEINLSILTRGTRFKPRFAPILNPRFAPKFTPRFSAKLTALSIESITPTLAGIKIPTAFYIAFALDLPLTTTIESFAIKWRWRAAKSDNDLGVEIACRSIEICPIASTGSSLSCWYGRDYGK